MDREGEGEGRGGEKEERWTEEESGRKRDRQMQQIRHPWAERVVGGPVARCAYELWPLPQ